MVQAGRQRVVHQETFVAKPDTLPGSNGLTAAGTPSRIQDELPRGNPPATGPGGRPAATSEPQHGGELPPHYPPVPSIPRRPPSPGAEDIRAYLRHLAIDRNVAASTRTRLSPDSSDHLFIHRRD